MERLEPIILKSLFSDDLFVRRVLPFLEPEYFLNKTERLIFSQAKTFIERFNALPTRETLMVDLDTSGAEEDTMGQVSDYLETDFRVAEEEEKPNTDWLVERTEGWCQEKAVHNAVLEVVKILDGKNRTHGKEMIPELLKTALGVSFDPNVGHDLFADSDKRHDFYNKKDSRLPFGLSQFNQATKNGIPNKTLNIILAGTNVGKSLFMCDLASTYIRQGKKVLYITMEMAEERIAERIDANLLDVMIDDLAMMSKSVYKREIEKVMNQTKGQLIIKEYPTASAHAGHFRHLLNELKLKKNFKPDAIFIDYLNICASGRMKASADSMYSLVKSIAEELRGLAVEFDVPIWSATQMNRAGFNNTDPDLTNTSESFGLPATADFMFALIRSDELKTMNQLVVKILKNRYGNPNFRNKDGKISDKFVVGVDYSKQRLYEDDAMKQDLSDDAAVAYPSAPQKVSPLADDTAPWEDDGTGTTTWAGPKEDWKAKIAEPVFDIDLPTSKREFRSAEEEAENRRNAAKGEVMPYAGHRVVSAARTNHGLKME